MVIDPQWYNPPPTTDAWLLHVFAKLRKSRERWRTFYYIVATLGVWAVVIQLNAALATPQ